MVQVSTLSLCPLRSSVNDSFSKVHRARSLTDTHTHTHTHSDRPPSQPHTLNAASLASRHLAHMMAYSCSTHARVIIGTSAGVKFGSKQCITRGCNAVFFEPFVTCHKSTHCADCVVTCADIACRPRESSGPCLPTQSTELAPEPKYQKETLAIPPCKRFRPCPLQTAPTQKADGKRNFCQGG